MRTKQIRSASHTIGITARITETTIPAVFFAIIASNPVKCPNQVESRNAENDLDDRLKSVKSIAQFFKRCGYIIHF